MKTLCIFWFGMILFLAGGCAQQPAPRGMDGGPLLEVPWVGMGASGHRGAFRQLSSAGVMLEETPVYGRWEKAILGQVPLATYSAYTVYTYDAQPIGALGGVGYRYRYIVRQGLEIP